MQSNTEQTNWQLIFCAWLVATASTVGSLFFSEIMDLVPCELCWYQRIFMFPLSLVLLVGLFPLDERVVNYGLPIAGLGLLVTLYHCLIFFGFIPASMQPCRLGVSCSDEGMVLLGLIPIPLLSLLAFSGIMVLLLITRYRIKHEK